MKDINFDEDDEDNSIIDETIYDLKSDKENGEKVVLGKQSITPNYCDGETIIFDEDNDLRKDNGNDKIIINSSDDINESEEVPVFDKNEEDRLNNNDEKFPVIDEDEEDKLNEKNEEDTVINEDEEDGVIEEEIIDDDEKCEEQKEKRKLFLIRIIHRKKMKTIMI
ncbi:hypothetical protein SNEBB_009739 [Seison nebaliae]|nr:hypothetical protein SNEBB_009739 [Seison nebaliae]